MLRIAICDDDPGQVDALKTLLFKWRQPVETVAYTSAEQFLFSDPDKPCDLLLLDIEMGGMSGMTLARTLRARGDRLPIVFITGYSEYMQDGYDVEALHYLLKPVEKERLFAVLDRYAARHVSDYRVIFPAGGESVSVECSRIAYLEAFGKTTRLVMKDGSSLTCACGLHAAAEKLGAGFIACHRSYIVNLSFVRSISKTGLTLDSGEQIPLSRRNYEDVSRAFIEYYKEHGR
ncbi:MAG: response regulator transcription factor [Oscillospiraceae bacterium]|nr:response regulator transcription factor [Oscillospiraceae bacterium]